MKILAINGSSPYDTKGAHRPHGGSTLKLLTKVVDAARAECDFHKVQANVKFRHLHEEIKGFYQGNYNYLPDYIVPLFRDMIEADILVFASPVQWYAMSDYMKSLINHMTALEYGAEDIGDKFPDLTLTDGRQIAGKVGAVIATCHHDGAMQVIQSIVAPLNDAGVIIPGGGSSFYNNKNWKVDPEDEDGDWQNLDHARVGQNLVREAIKQQRTKDLDVNNWEAREDA